MSTNTPPNLGNVKKVLARNTRFFRLERDWTQEQLAHAADIRMSYVSEIERMKRNVSIEYVEKLASALDKQPYEMLKPIPPL